MDKLDKYYMLMEEKPEHFINNNENLVIEKDRHVIEEYMNEHHVQIGVIYQSPYQMLVVDLVRDKNHKYYTYERIIKEDHGVVIIPKYQDKYILLKQYRHALRQSQYAFPRGFGEKGISAKENAIKELEEELHATVSSIKPLANIVIDSGVCGNEVSFFFADIQSYEIKRDYEGIEEVVLLNEEELQEWIKTGIINDCMTIAGVGLLNHS